MEKELSGAYKYKCNAALKEHGAGQQQNVHSREIHCEKTVRHLESAIIRAAKKIGRMT